LNLILFPKKQQYDKNCGLESKNLRTKEDLMMDVQPAAPASFPADQISGTPHLRLSGSQADRLTG
jgi:hypothetical protein